MWLLILIVMLPSGPSETILERYGTERECDLEQVRVWRDMEDAYPKDHNYSLICRYVWRVI